MTTMQREFEAVTCTRCGGSGNCSYNQMYGTRCFKCGGAKRVYTKRGAMALHYYNELLSVPASELKPGMKIREMRGLSGQLSWITLTTIDDNSVTRSHGAIINGECVYSGLNIHADGWTYGAVPPDQKFRIAHTAEVKRAAREKALDYQDTLTKSGKPRKG